MRSVAGPRITILDGNSADSVVAFTSAEGRETILEGLTIHNGRAVFDGGGIRIDRAPIRGNVVINNKACIGVGISVEFGSPLIEDNRIAGNVHTGCSRSGGGIRVGGAGSAHIRRNVIEDNVVDFAHSQPLATRATFVTEVTAEVQHAFTEPPNGFDRVPI